VDGLESDLNGRADVHRLDLFSDVGRQAASTYGVKIIPTILVFDGQGRLILRQNGMLNAEAVQEKIAQLYKDE
jgi:thioredoxin-related protein